MISSLYSESLGLDGNKCRMFFSFDNVYCIFRNSKRNMTDSSAGEVVRIEELKHDSVSGLLEEIFFDVLYNGYDLQAGDVLGVRLDGEVYCYRYMGHSRALHCGVESVFLRMHGFIENERHDFLHKIHKSGKVLSVLDNRLYHVSNINTEQFSVYAIDYKSFYESRRTADFPCDYLLYHLGERRIEVVNPQRKPFLVKNIAFHFFEMSKEKNDSLLLLGVNELEMVQDYQELYKAVI